MEVINKDDDQIVDQHRKFNPEEHRNKQNPDSNSSSNQALVCRVMYTECQKNHAASTGGYVIDGCGEFMPNGEEGTPAALKCAACDCHRNFHRKQFTDRYPFHITQNKTGPSSSQTVMMTFGGKSEEGGKSESSSQDVCMFEPNWQTFQQQHQQQPAVMKKRFRTKLSKEQKDRMVGFAEKIKWRVGKQEEDEVDEFCNEIGIKRDVFKVWMHNNKQAMRNKKKNM